MPELPEVETIRRGLTPQVLGSRITRLTVRNARLRWPVPTDFAAFALGRRITATSRRGKYLLLHLDGGEGRQRIIIHLGMSGRLQLHAAAEPAGKHDHLDFLLRADSGAEALLRYQDPRRFGAVLPWDSTQPHPLMQTMGPEPFSEEFSGEYLFARSRGKSLAVKSLVMDGGVVVGAGNIYAAESLFRAGIRPTRAAGRVSRAEYGRLAEKIREVLLEAIEQGGTTLRDFAGAHGEAGYFQQDLYVYGRAGLPCRVCAATIQLTRLGNRQSCWCPGCQR